MAEGVFIFILQGVGSAHLVAVVACVTRTATAAGVEPLQLPLVLVVFVAVGGLILAPCVIYMSFV